MQQWVLEDFGENIIVNMIDATYAVKNKSKCLLLDQAKGIGTSCNCM